MPKGKYTMKKLCTLLAILCSIAASGRSAAAATVIKPPEIKISGYTQIGYIRNDSTINTINSVFSDASMEDGFKLIRSRFTFKGDIDPKVSMNVQIDVAARHATNTQALNLITDAYFDMKFLKGHNIRLGQFKLPFGLENPISDAKTFPINASVVKNTSINTRDIGIDISAKHPTYEYHIAAVNGAGQNKNDNNSKKDVLASAAVIWHKMTIGASAINSKGDSAQTTLRHGYDGYVQALPNWGEVDFEFMRGTDRTAARRHGWYASVFPKLNDRTWIVARYERYDPNKAATTPNGVTRTTAGILYKTSKYSSLRLNYEWRTDKAAVKSGDVCSFLWQVEY
jgi:hypothetical protein